MSLNRQLLKNSLIDWYNEHHEYLQIIRYLNWKYDYEKEDKEKPKLPPEYEDLPSLRQIDYCVVNFGKRHKSCFLLEKPNGSKVPFEIHAEYKSALRANSKDLFDPFRRGEKFTIGGPHGLEVKTTICQLNFFRWAIPNKVLDYAIRNAPAIEREMAKKIKSRKRKRASIATESTSTSSRKIKEEINKSNPSRCLIHNVPSIVGVKPFPENAIKPYEFYKVPSTEEE